MLPNTNVLSHSTVTGVLSKPALEWNQLTQLSSVLSQPAATPALPFEGFANEEILSDHKNEVGLFYKQVLVMLMIALLVVAREFFM